jgi:hypothetical protein
MTTALAMCLGAALMLALVWLRRNFLSFRAQRPDHYAHLSPPFDLRQHLSGPLVLEGILYGPTGRVTSRFVADAEGIWHGDDGTLREVFHYDSGRVQTREWKLRLLPGNRIEGRAEDVDGVAIGHISGPTVQMHYRYRLPADAGGHVLSVTDWMYLAPNGSILNRSQFVKAGITVAELVATIRPKTVRSDIARDLAAE